MTTIPGYTLTSEMYRSTKSLIYRGYCDADGQLVIVKTLQSAYCTPDDVARFRHEYETARSLLEVGGVVRPYALEKYHNTLALVLEDFGAQSLRNVADSRAMDIESFLQIALPLVETLGEIHKRDIVHKDLNPNNILCNRGTGQVKITDFGLASRLSRENQPMVNLHLLEGTLAYMSPEQTGRMNRVIDYRTDFYSLGVTFYELLTGQLPFPVTDPLELVHSHIAKNPVPPHELNSEIPQAVSGIILKLLSKMAEDRYQSAHGLQADLMDCLAQLKASGKIAYFMPGRTDVSERFQIPQKLYGRAAEIAVLIAAFDRVSQGASEMLLVSGYAGIGKSSLIHEIHKPIVRQRGFFIAGKFDQYKRDIPYASVIQAFEALIRQLLTESEARIAVWKQRLLEAFGPNGQVIIDVIPEVELIVGKQPPVPQLGPIESQNRFNLVFQNFVGVFARVEHPLVIFLDDLQWADSASLKLLELLAVDPDGQYFVIIGAYRANEVSASHPLMLILNKVREARAKVEHIMLRGLDLPHIIELMQDTLGCDEDRARPLAQLVFEKTDGNPFFLNQFLTSLYGEHLLQFNTRLGRWEWDLERIQARTITDNVVELMAGKIQKLSTRAQQVLKLASCIGNRFDLQTLSTVNEKTPKQTANDLWETITEGLIMPIGDTYRLVQASDEEIDFAVTYEFLHDRVQQAAYSLIPEEQKQAVHVKVGHLLLENTAAHDLEDRIFEIVNQLNFGTHLIAEPDEKYRLAQLNLTAGNKAKASMAHEAALKCLAVGLQLLSLPSWQEQYQLSFDLHLQYAELLALIGQLEEANRFFSTVVEHARTEYERGICYDIHSEVLQCAGKAADAFKMANNGLALFSLPLPDTPEDTQRETAHLMSALLNPEAIQRLERLPEARGRETLLISRLYDRAIISCYFSQPHNLGLVISKSVEYVLRAGITRPSGTAIVWFAMIAAGQGHMALALEYAELAVKFVNTFHDAYVKGRVDMLAYCMCLGWKYPFRVSEKSLHDTYLLCHSTGDLQYASYALLCKYIAALAQGQDGQAILEYGKQWRDYCEKYVPLELGQAHIRVYAMQRLMDVEQQELDAVKIIDAYEAGKNYTDVCESLMELARVSTLLGDYQAGYDQCQRAEPMIVAGAAGNLLLIMLFYHVYGICCARLYTMETDSDRQQGYLDQLHSHLAKLRTWAELTPDNFQSYASLVEAELARALGDRDRAAASYLKTIQHAQQHEYTLLQAMANEFLAELYQLEGYRFARGHIAEAYYLWLACGITGKAHALAKRFPFLAQDSRTVFEPVSLTTMETDTSVVDAYSQVLDLATVLKAAQAISGEIVLDRLLERMMRIMLENAGAQKGCLALEKDGRLVIEAEGHVEHRVQVLQAVPIDASSSLPAAMVHYVARTKEPVVLVDATQAGLFTTDPYVVRNQAKSILCMPLLNQGKLIGLLYLENALTAGAFTPACLQVLSLLASQAAIAIENARLYAQQEEYSRILEDRVTERTAQLAQANAEIIALNAQLQAENLRMGAELEVTRKLQHMLLPTAEELHQIADLDIACYMEPADEVGGDYYDVLQHNGQIKIGIGDVTGHGLESGVVMVMTQAIVRALLMSGETDPVRFFDTLNRALYGNVQRMGTDKNLTLSLLDYAAGDVRLSGQHEKMLVVRYDGTVEVVDTMDLGFPVALTEEIADFIQHTTVRLQPGDGVVLYTDGLTEAENLAGQQYGFARLCTLVSQHWAAPAELIKERVALDVHQHMGAQRMYDDITLVVVKRR